MTYGYRGPTIDHGSLSPSGKVSKRARKAALARETARLFPPGTWPDQRPETPQEAATRLRRSAHDLLDLAERGMRPVAHRKAAARLLAEADALEATP